MASGKDRGDWGRRRDSDEDTREGNRKTGGRDGWGKNRSGDFDDNTVSRTVPPPRPGKRNDEHD